MKEDRDPNRVEVKIGNKVFCGWKSVVISMSVEQVARAFAMEVTTDFPGNVDFRGFQTGDLCEVRIGDELVCTGYIESTPVSYDGKKVSVQIQGKSKTIDLVQCCPPSSAYPAPSSEDADLWGGVKGKSVRAVNSTPSPSVPNSWKNLPVAQIIAELASPYGIKVSAPSLGNRVATHTVNPGETVLKSIDRLISKENLILTDDAGGNLVIMEVASSGEPVATLKAGENILFGTAKFDASKRFSQYVVLGQHKGTDDDNGKSSAEDKGMAVDAGVSRYRLTVIKDSGQSSTSISRRRAEFEAKYRAAQFFGVEYAVLGWRDPSGRLWALNSVVCVDDEVLRIRGNCNVAGVEFRLDSSGMTSKLTLLPENGVKAWSSVSDEKQTETASDLWAGVK